MKLSAIQKFTILDYPNKVACIAFTPGCNMRCGFCHNPEFVLPEKIRELDGNFIAEETFFRFLDQRRGLLEGVVVSGGEPTIWQDLPEFFGKIKALGFLTKLDTNGNHPEMLEQLLREKLVDYVAMDVKTSLAQYPKLVGGGVKCNNIAESMELLKSSGTPYEFRTTLIKEVHNEEVLGDMKQMLAGAEKFFLQTFRPGHTLNSVFATYHPFSSEETDRIAQTFQKEVASVSIRN
ncbi:MAG: anaerobic ribonucleoside-triphosphate reductase activating protein [Candidatus Moranbacteria bacterium]|nr:anaerobic ribonucleoside-triphosphate reductase activating protein [Candidatus Moranbacteria bacterium]